MLTLINTQLSWSLIRLSNTSASDEVTANPKVIRYTVLHVAKGKMEGPYKQVQFL